MVMSSASAWHATWRRRRRGFAAGVALVGVALAGSGCSITEKRNQSRLITNAHQRLVDSGTSLLSVTVQEKAIAIDAGFAAQSSSQPLRAGQLAPARNETVVTNFPKREALVIPAAKGAAKASPAQYFNDGVIYQRLPNVAASSHPWLQLDYGQLYDKRKSQAGLGYGHALLNPLWVVDLLKGTLTGSVKRLGPARTGGVATIEYAANFAWDKSLKGTGDQHTRAVEAALTLLGVPSSVVKGNVWLDAAGNVRQLWVSIREHKGRHQVVAWHYTINFAAIGQAVAIALPKQTEVARVDTLGSVLDAETAASSPLAAS